MPASSFRDSKVTFSPAAYLAPFWNRVQPVSFSLAVRLMTPAASGRTYHSEAAVSSPVAKTEVAPSALVKIILILVRETSGFLTSRTLTFTVSLVPM